MSEEPICAALEAAGEALRNAVGWPNVHQPDGLYTKHAAAAIAAFLRAMPTKGIYLAVDGKVVAAINCQDFWHIADAVEAEAAP